MSATGPINVKDRWQRGFTLLELILVLTLLAVAAALIAPALSDFMRGRALDAEAVRLLSVTHAAQARAVAEGLPVRVWLEAAQGRYGTEEETRPGAKDAKAMSFDVDPSVRIVLENANTARGSTPALRFLPDGSIDETSPASVRLNDVTGATLWLVQSRNRLSYEISRTKP